MLMKGCMWQAFLSYTVKLTAWKTHVCGYKLVCMFEQLNMSSNAVYVKMSYNSKPLHMIINKSYVIVAKWYNDTDLQ